LRFVAGDFKDLAQMSDRCFANLATGKKGESRTSEEGHAHSGKTGTKKKRPAATMHKTPISTQAKRGSFKRDP
jgi:hypothetical protein